MVVDVCSFLEHKVVAIGSRVEGEARAETEAEAEARGWRLFGWGPKVPSLSLLVGVDG